MIKFEIDFQKATQAEIDAFYAIPGMQSAISQLQTHNRQYNALVTVLTPNDQLAEVKVLILEFMRKFKVEAGNLVPARPFQNYTITEFNPKQRALIDGAFAALVSEGVLEPANGDFKLTTLGFETIY